VILLHFVISITIINYNDNNEVVHLVDDLNVNTIVCVICYFIIAKLILILEN